LEEKFPNKDFLGAPQNTGGEKRVIVRHRRSDADNGCPPKAADGRQEHTRYPKKENDSPRIVTEQKGVTVRGEVCDGRSLLRETADS